MTEPHRVGMGRELGSIGAASTGVGAAIVTIIAGSCCVSPVLAPIIVSLLGASGAAWAAGLKPYSGWILAASFLVLSLGFWSVYRPRTECAVGEAPARRALPRVAKASLWFGALCWVASVIVTLTVRR